MYQNRLGSLDQLEVSARIAEIIEWQGVPVLRLDGLALLPWQGQNLSLELEIAAERACYAGIAFHAVDQNNYELVYAQPHTSGQWDALQYDPVFNGSNTWQIYHGAAYQQAAILPTGQWFRLRLDVFDECAAVSVDGQAPLVVQKLVRPAAAEKIGLWSYLPAYFRNLTVQPCYGLAVRGQHPEKLPNCVDSWLLDGIGKITCEENGVCNLNRYLPMTAGKAVLKRRFYLPERNFIHFNLGYSDQIVLKIDGQVVFEGEYCFMGIGEAAARGYVGGLFEHFAVDLAAGTHEICAETAVCEPFGWGVILNTVEPVCWLDEETV